MLLIKCVVKLLQNRFECWAQVLCNVCSLRGILPEWHICAGSSPASLLSKQSFDFGFVLQQTSAVTSLWYITIMYSLCCVQKNSDPVPTFQSQQFCVWMNITLSLVFGASCIISSRSNKPRLHPQKTLPPSGGLLHLQTYTQNVWLTVMFPFCVW